MKKAAIGYLFQEKITIFLYLTVLELVIIPKNIYDICKNFNIITNIYRIQHINSNLCGLFCILFCLYKINNKNKFIEFLNLFNVKDYIKNELV